MQHDIRFEEQRQPHSQLYAWCVCGLWWYQSEMLNRAIPMEGFMSHLINVQSEAVGHDKGVGEYTGLQPDEQGHWG